MSSISVDNYLKNVYELGISEGKVTTNLLAKRLNIAPASVTGMIKKLSKQGYLRHVPYQGVEVTEKGKRSALRIIRKHRLWEMFLLEVLRFPWDSIHEEAEAFEHIMSEKIENRIDEVLGFPTVDPHGAPIPSKNGTVKKLHLKPLEQSREGSTVQVLSVNDENPELLQYASSIGISLNSKIVIKQKNAFDGSLVIRVGNKDTVISSTLAHNIFVEA